MKEKLRIPQRILAINTNNKLVLVLLTVSLRKDCKTVAGALWIGCHPTVKEWMRIRHMRLEVEQGTKRSKDLDTSK